MLKFVLAVLCSLSFGLVQAGDFTDQADIPHWGSPAVDYLVENGVISGNADGSLAPGRSINRAEFLKILTVATETNVVNNFNNSFPDVPGNAWFYPYVNTAVSQGWAKGYPDGEFKPGNLINRAEVAKLLAQAFALDYEPLSQDQNWFDGPVRALSGHKLIPYGATTTNFLPGTEPTRIEIFEQLHRAMIKTSPDTEIQADIPLPVGQEQSVPDPSDDKFLTFTPTTETSSAKLNVKSTSTGQKTSVSAGQNSINLMSLSISSSASAQMDGIQLRRIGNGAADDFSTIWAEYGGNIVSAKVTPQSDFVYLKFGNSLTLSGNRTIQIEADIAGSAGTGNSSRWVVFLPDWIDTDAQSTIGFFPVGGRDINIK